MKVTLTHDGKSVELDLTAEQMTALGLKEEKKKTGYENNETHYYVDCFGNVYGRFGDQRNYYANANLYTDQDLAMSNARADRLMRRLRRFAAENGGIPSVEDWKNTITAKYNIFYDHTKNSLRHDTWYIARHVGPVYFNDMDACYKAIELYHDELIWYFTEYEAMLR